MSDPADRARSIFLDVIENYAPGQWASYLDRACAGDGALRARVDRLLRAQAALGSFHEVPKPRLVATADEPLVERPGTVIGTYKLMEQIGEGGMGLVFVAEQQHPVRRKVALKVIKPGMRSRQVIARFEAERQALALMDHPNIAKVHDGGTTPEGRPYFVMELVKGTPITAYCDQQRLTTRQRLGLFADVCRAVQHAHQKGIIHRDLKPSNVLVAVHDVKPVVKVIDFGIAKAAGQQLTDKTLYTQFAQMVGTPLYMSPEQAGASSLDVDTRSDVYSLGVLLYELLTGTTPFEAEALKQAGYDEMRRIIREEEPPRPSTRLSTLKQAALSTVAACRAAEPGQLGRQVRGELDWVVMKCLEKDRDRRYESAGALADDVQRYLADEPLQASPPSAAYRLRKLARRHKVALTTVGLVIVALLAVAISTGYVLRDRSTRQAVVTARVTDALDESERLYRAGLVPEALTAARRAESLLATGPAGDALAARVQERIEDLDTVLQLDQVLFKSAQPQVRHAEYERLFRRYGIDLSTQSDEEAAAQIRGRFIALDLAVALDQWHVFPTGKAFDRKLTAVARQADPDDWRDRVRAAFDRNDRAAVEEVERTAPVDQLPPATIRTILLCSFWDPLALREQPRRDFMRRALLRFPNDVWLNWFLADSLTYCEPKNIEEGVGHYWVLVALRPHSPVIYVNLGYSMEILGRLDEALGYYRTAIERDAMYAGTAYTALAGLLHRKGHADEAIATLRKAVALNPYDAGIRVEVGRAFVGMGRLVEAIADYKEALRLEPDSAAAQNGLAWGLANCPDPKFRDIPRAVALAKRAVELAPGNYHIWNTLGVAHLRAGDWKAAVEALTKCEAVAPGVDWGDNAFFLAMAHWQLGEKEQARQWYARGVAWMAERAPVSAYERLQHCRAEAEELLGIPKPLPAKDQPATPP
jgi:serine/threonine protein kinase/Flp pilus assembly protein TadD